MAKWNWIYKMVSSGQISRHPWSILTFFSITTSKKLRLEGSIHQGRSNLWEASSNVQSAKQTHRLKLKYRIINIREVALRRRQVESWTPPTMSDKIMKAQIMLKFSKCLTVVLERRLTPLGFSSEQEFLTKRWRRIFLTRALIVTIDRMEALSRGIQMPRSTTKEDPVMISPQAVNIHR